MRAHVNWLGVLFILLERPYIMGANSLTVALLSVVCLFTWAPGIKPMNVTTSVILTIDTRGAKSIVE